MSQRHRKTERETDRQADVQRHRKTESEIETRRYRDRETEISDKTVLDRHRHDSSEEWCMHNLVALLVSHNAHRRSSSDS